MQLFVSYARVDKPYCVQIVHLLEDVHEIWYDARMYAGLHWWPEILRRLDWSEGFIYLMSPESIESKYCRQEFELAQSLGRPIFPVLIHPDTAIPPVLANIQYADLSQGLTPEAVKVLLTSIHKAENDLLKRTHPPVALKGDLLKEPVLDAAAVIGAAAAAMSNGQFDNAVFLLKQAREKGYTSRFINIDELLVEAETALTRQTYLREAEREYSQILALVQHKITSKIGCEAFRSFRQAFPDYDPENLRAVCTGETSPQSKIRDILPMFEWCPIPEGKVRFRYVDSQSEKHEMLAPVKSFQISKYPITNTQFQVFLNDRNGYANTVWWDFSPEAKAWRQKHLLPRPSAFKGDERPREMVTWYEAMAFCNWLSHYLGQRIGLPTAFEWQRAFQGDDQRAFPWGNSFDKNRCNSSENNLKMTTNVTRYEQGVSPFGVYDMAGNVWEWCLNQDADHAFGAEILGSCKRVIRGGSFMSPGLRSHISFLYYLQPESHYSSIGFRIVTPMA